MQRSLAAVAFMALGGFAANYALGMKMYTSEGPGAGLFPLIIGIGLIVVGGLWFVQLRASPGTGEPLSIGLWPAVRIAAQVAALLLFAFLLPRAGFVVAAAVLVVATAVIAGERNWIWIAIVTAGCSIGVQRLFRLLGTDL